MQKKFRKYALLLLKKGLCIKEGKPLLINAPVEAYEFIRVLTEVACSLGVRDIYYDWYDDCLKYTELKYFNDEEIKKSKFWDKSIHDEYAKKDAAFLMLISNSNIDMENISSDKLMVAGKHSLSTRSEYRRMQENNLVNWCIGSVATKEWANLVFGDRNDDTNKLWNKIFEVCLIDKEEPIEEWNNNIKINHMLCEKLNNLRIKELHYENSLGTDLYIYLDKTAKWCGGSSIIKGEEALVNIPSEEVFTTPDKRKTKGIVYMSMPLVHQGVMIEDICLEFEEGKVVNYKASVGLEELKNIIEIDNESCMLGEAALVDKNSPIKKSGLLFYETLFDENAACHIALGAGFKECLEGADGLTDEELEDRGYNKAKSHVDMMLGTDDMEITAVTYDGKIVKIFEKGSFVI